MVMLVQMKSEVNYLAQRRMFSLKIIDSDAFIDMPISARCLYYDLAMRADDDGFVSSPKKILRMTGASNDDLNVLILRKFIIPFESGICVVSHWRIHNYIQKDRYQSTIYKNEKELLIVDESNVYEKKNKDVSNLDTKCIQDVSSLDTQVRLGKVRLELVKPIVEFLNEKIKTNYKYTSKKTQSLIKARVNEGFTFEDFKIVINNKTKQWLGDPDMKRFLRPETLFGTKFESYLNEKEVDAKDIKVDFKSKVVQHNFDQREYSEADFDKFLSNKKD